MNHSSPYPHSLPLPRQFNNSRFNLLSLLGKGGMGEVYLARDQVLDKEVAIKVLHSEISEAQILRFRQEAVAVARLKHSNILEVYDFAQAEEGNFYLTMEVVRGRSLEELVRERATLPVPEFFEVADQLLAGLEHAHKAGVLHRDIKPSNVMLTESDSVEVKLVDFGLAKNLSSDELSLTRPGLVMGSPYYMSPEQIRGGEIDGRSDIYSFGCLAYKVLTGAVPFAGDDALATMNSHLSDLPRSLSAFDPELPSEIDSLVIKCLSKDPGARFEDVSSLRQALDEAKHSYFQEESSDASEPYKIAAEARSRTRPVLWAVLSVFAVLTGIAAWALLFRPVEQTSVRKVFTSRRPPLINFAISSAVSPEELPKLLNKNGELSLDGRTLSERDLSILPVLKGLRILSLEGGNVDDGAMAALARCRELQELSLSGNKGISPQALALIYDLPLLGKLELANMGLTNAHLSGISRLPSLYNLNISSNDDIDSGALEALVPLTYLCDFKVGSKKLPMREIVDFCNRKASIASLGLRSFPSPDRGLGKLSELKYVKSLDLSFNPEVDRDVLLSALAIPGLTALNLAGSRIQTEELLVLNKNPRIVTLNLNKRGLTSSDVVNLQKLRYIERLQVRDNAMLSIEDLNRLNQIKKLKRLDSGF